MLTSDVCDDGFHPFFYSYNIEINYCFTFVRFSFENNFPTEDSERDSRREGAHSVNQATKQSKGKKLSEDSVYFAPFFVTSNTNIKVIPKFMSFMMWKRLSCAGERRVSELMEEINGSPERHLNVKFLSLHFIYEPCFRFLKCKTSSSHSPEE